VLETMLRNNLMLKRRSRMEISAEILRIARTGARKTKVVYGANLNFKLLNEYLDRLEKAGLIRRENGEPCIIKTTEKGRKYLQQFQELRCLGMI